MPATVTTLLRGLLLGLGAAAPIGPVNVEIARRTLCNGFRSGFALGCGAVTVDVTYAILATFSLRRALTHDWVIRGLGVAGAAILIYLAIGCFRAAAKQQAVHDGAAAFEARNNSRPARNYLTGLLMTSFNPMTLAFWFVAVPGFVAQITSDPKRDLPLICAAVFVAALAWVCGFTGLLALAAGRAGAAGGVKRRWLVAADLTGGLLLLTFASLSIWRVAHPLL